MEKAKFCTNCGASLGEGQNACASCGATIGNKTEIVTEVVVETTVSETGEKSKVAAGVLGILLGSLGVHNFYLGYTGKAVAQLLISVLSLGLLSGVSAIWGLVEGIMILTGSIKTDAKGQLLKD